MANRQTTNHPTKKEMQDLIDDVGEKVAEMLDPVLTREELVAQVQELDALVNGSDDEEDEDDSDEEDDDEAA